MYLKKLPGADNPSLTYNFVFSSSFGYYLKCLHLAILFINLFKVNQIKKNLTRDFELVMM